MIHLILLCGIAVANIDVNTFSNYQDVRTTHLHIEWLLDLDDKYINATAQYQFVVKTNQLEQINLDIYQLDIHLAYLSNGKVLQHQIENMGEQSLKQGDRLQIILDRPYMINEIIKLRIRYSVTQKARALSFMNPEQTESKILPYLYSYCQDNNCRSMIPLQDTPSVKQLFSAVVLTKDPRIKVFMTGNLLQDKPFQLMNDYSQNGLTEYHFSLDLPLPAYLIAIVAGNLEERKVGNQQTSKSYVITEPTSIERVAKELEDLQDYVDRMQIYIGPYDWGVYKIVIMPPSFPLGGMEHPLLTFASPTIIVGDKSGIVTAIHEIGHSWTGNTVTCEDWQNMWINEGFTTFLERKILGQINGVDYVKLDAYLGNYTTFMTMQMFGFNHTYSSLHPDTLNENPDDSVSNVPYDKGYQLLVYIEDLLGEAKFQRMLREYVVYFKWLSINEDNFYQFLLGWVTRKMGEEANAINAEITDIYKKWVYVGGLPPRTVDFSTDALTVALKLGSDWLDGQGQTVPANAEAFNTWKYNQKSITLSKLQTQADQISVELFDLLDQTYNLSDDPDSRLLYRWFIICLTGRYYKQEPKIKVFMGTHGAKSWLMRMYTTLYEDKPQTAIDWFNEYRDFYHPSVTDALLAVFNGNQVYQ